jgi:hypothetical protein
MKFFESLSNAEIIYKWGQAILVSCALLAGFYTLTARAVSTVRAGPEAKLEAASLNVRVTRLERQSRFLVRGMERLTRTKYPDAAADNRGED